MTTLAAQLEQDAQTVRQKIGAQLVDLLHSQKVQALVLGHVIAALEVFLGAFAKAHGVDPAIVDPLLMKFLVGTFGSAGLFTAAHAYVDGQATAAGIAAEAGKAPGQVADDVAHAELARVRAELVTKTQQLAAVSQMLRPTTASQ